MKKNNITELLKELQEINTSDKEFNVENSIEKAKESKNEWNNSSAEEDFISYKYKKREENIIKEYEEKLNLYKERSNVHSFTKYIVVGYLLFIVIILTIQMATEASLVKNYGIVGFSDSVLIALLTTTTATVIGLYMVIAKGVFQSKENLIKK
tara:strand:- start:167 stop:625 length:459 start_codon:yes stop_codon:yes gene_type:complete